MMKEMRSGVAVRGLKVDLIWWWWEENDVVEMVAEEM